MEPINASYNEFPASTASADGMLTLPKQEYDRIRLDILTYDAEHELKILYISHEPSPSGFSSSGSAEKAVSTLPLIFYVQGSAWMEQTLHANIFELSAMAKNGYNVAICQYRGTDFGPFPLQLEDSKRGLKYLTDHAEEYHIDVNNIFLWGDSSGGHTVMMMAVTENRFFQNFRLPEIRGVIDFYGPTHIASMNDVPSTQDHMGPDSPEGRLIGCLAVPEHPELAEKTVIMNYVSEDVPLAPVLMMHGNKDRLVPFEQSIELYECLNKNNKDVTFYKLTEADHGGVYFWHETTLKIVDNFIKDRLQ